MLCYSSTVCCSWCRCHRGQLSFLFYFIFLKKMGNVGVFPWRAAMMGRASRAKGAVVLPLHFPLSSPPIGTKTSQRKREEHRGSVDWIETFFMSPALYTFSHIGRNFQYPPLPAPTTTKNISMPPVYILANPIISQILNFRDVILLLSRLLQFTPYSNSSFKIF